MARDGTRLELRPDVLRRLAFKGAHLVRQTALADRPQEALLERADDARRTVADHQQRIGQPAPARFSTMMGWGREGRSSSAMARARMSVPPLAA
jgi:hypothetical protein